MRKVFMFLIAMMTLGITGAHAQKAGIGIRFSPDGIGGTGKVFISRNVALEGMLNAGGIFNNRANSVVAVGLVEYHIPIEAGWRLYVGAGGHIGSWDAYRHRDSKLIAGLDGIFGVEYLFRSAPLAFSLDVKPAINLVPEVEWFGHNVLGLGLKVYF